jgi:hypothetical protein
MNLKNRQFFFDLRGRLLAGIVSQEDAEREALPVIEKMNMQGKAIAKKHGKQFHPFSFAALVR